MDCMNSTELLRVQDLQVRFPAERTLLGRATAWIHAVNGVGFSIQAGETVGLVGESGCGKSTLGRAVVRLVRPTSGRILFEGQDLAPLSERQLRPLRRRFQMIFQDPYASLNPRMTVQQLVEEPLVVCGLAAKSDQRRDRVRELLTSVGLEPSHAERYPHEFSGGQRQRIGIARALAAEPSLIVCDEPVSALDVSVQAQVVNLLQDLQRQRKVAYLFVAHDLAVVEHLSHRILVMYLGKILESGAAKDLVRHPRHPYTQALISATPEIDPDSKRRRIVLSGEVPSPIHPPSGCAFHPRCPVAVDRCRVESPALRDVGNGNSVACHVVSSVPTA